MRSEPNAAVLVSRTIVLPAGTTTSAPAAGTVPPHVVGLDHNDWSGAGGAAVAVAVGAAAVLVAVAWDAPPPPPQAVSVAQIAAIKLSRRLSLRRAPCDSKE